MLQVVNILNCTAWPSAVIHSKRLVQLIRQIHKKLLNSGISTRILLQVLDMTSWYHGCDLDISRMKSYRGLFSKPLGTWWAWYFLIIFDPPPTVAIVGKPEVQAHQMHHRADAQWYPTLRRRRTDDGTHQNRLIGPDLDGPRPGVFVASRYQNTAISFGRLWEVFFNNQME